jgi:hypothetical protein
MSEQLQHLPPITRIEKHGWFETKGRQQKAHGTAVTRLGIEFARRGLSNTTRTSKKIVYTSNHNSNFQSLPPKTTSYKQQRNKNDQTT